MLLKATTDQYELDNQVLVSLNDLSSFTVSLQKSPVHGENSQNLIIFELEK